jgi:hypothetical protein
MKEGAYMLVELNSLGLLLHYCLFQFLLNVSFQNVVKLQQLSLPNQTFKSCSLVIKSDFKVDC